MIADLDLLAQPNREDAQIVGSLVDDPGLLGAYDADAIEPLWYQAFLSVEAASEVGDMDLAALSAARDEIRRRAANAILVLAGLPVLV